MTAERWGEAPEHARELARVPSHAAEVLADVRDRGAQFGVADLYREHRVRPRADGRLGRRPLMAVGSTQSTPG